MTFVAWIIFIAAAVLEVGGDAVIRSGLRGRGLVFIAAGCLAAGAYGLVVNMVKWDFSRLLGVYVALLPWSASCAAGSCSRRMSHFPPGAVLCSLLLAV